MPGILSLKLNINIKKSLSKQKGWAVPIEWRQNSSFHQNTRHLVKDMLLLLVLPFLRQMAAHTNNKFWMHFSQAFAEEGREPTSLNLSTEKVRAPVGQWWHQVLGAQWGNFASVCYKAVGSWVILPLRVSTSVSVQLPLREQIKFGGDLRKQTENKIEHPIRQWQSRPHHKGRMTERIKILL